MARCEPARFDLVLLDPPFDSGLAAPALLAATRVAAPGGFVYVEAPEALGDAPAGFELHRAGRAGSVHFHLLRRLPG
jgi:16S rRNA G966 N2-methylase RsmD